MTATAEKKEAAPVSQSGWKKWGGRIGKFLLYGGWIVIAFLAVGIMILVSMLSR